MKEQTRKQILKEAQKEAYISLQSYMRYQYYYGEEDWDDELPYIERAYRYRLWLSLLKQKPVIANQVTTYLTFDEVRARLETREVVFHELDYETPITQEEFDILVSIYDETHVMSGEVCKRVLEDYHKEKLTYEKTSASCDQKLQAILDEHDALFEIDIVSFSPEKFFGYITFKEQLGINT